MKRWYVVQVYTGFEEVVKADLAARIKEEAADDLFGEILVPTGDAVEFLADADESKKKKIFPGYLLVQMEMTGESFRVVSLAARVTRFLGGKTPVPLSDKEIERIFSQIEGKIPTSTHKHPFLVGHEVQISDGPFSGFVGLIDKIDEDHERLSVMVSIFGRLTPIELGFNQVKK
jgi:transcriptional antiterminator NusG